MNTEAPTSATPEAEESTQTESHSTWEGVKDFLGWSKKKPKHKESSRDTFESILFALVLAFLFRTFEAEAFVIPTGSMAPTLYGRHKECTCSQCGFKIVVGASDEVNPETGLLWNSARLRSAICSNCGYENTQIFEANAYNGDRILVNKYPYEFGEPDRWDVFVFKWPEEPQTNYIKRLVGLPGETLRLRSGNAYSWDGENERILRKAPDKQRGLQIPVYDHNHAPKPLIEAGWPERWAAVQKGDVGRVAGWSETDRGWQMGEDRAFSVASDASDLQWLRYRHYFPDQKDWNKAANGEPLDPQPQLIGDFCGYNTYTGDHPQHFESHTADSIDTGPYWVADLTLNFDVQIDSVSDGGELIVELIEGTSTYRCRIDIKSGAAVLEEINSQLNNRVEKLAEAKTYLSGTGAYSISYANVDDRICLWINNSLVNFGEGALINQSGATANPFPTNDDLTPAGIAAKGVSATVSNMLLERDIYYRADFALGDPNYHDNKRFERNLERSMHQPETWAEIYLLDGARLDFLEIDIPEGHFVALGDNSPRSRDSRLWRSDMQTVPRKFLVGKAFWIYWPHGVPFLNDGRGYPMLYHKQQGQRGAEKVEDYPKHSFPFYPQVTRMKRIR